mmetsp:Transcript_26187/g.52986  ORF Transcript_26187/g.52986 Transcript_26187/m.52986 type:complete len:168 (+) Transcript_26187:242-745(+)
MKPAWDKLMTEYKGSKTILVADVDCTAEGKDLCEQVGIQGFPTIKYGDPDDLQDYDGGRDFPALKSFADGLGPLCNPGNLDLCDEEKKKQIDEYKQMSAEAREKIIEEKQGEMEKLESDFKEFVEGLQKQYEEESSKKDKGVAAIKQGGLGLIKSVHNYMKKAKSEL